MIRRPRVKASVNLKRKLPNQNSKETNCTKVVRVETPTEVSKTLDSNVEDENIKNVESTLPKSPIKSDKYIIQDSNEVQKNNQKSLTPLRQSCDIPQIDKSSFNSNIEDNSHSESVVQSNNSINEDLPKLPGLTAKLVDNVTESPLKPTTQTKEHATEDCFKLPKPASSFRPHAYGENLLKSPHSSGNTFESIESQVNKSHGTSQVKLAARPRVKPVPSLSHRRNMTIPTSINSTKADETTSGNADFISSTLNKASNASQNLSNVTKTFGRIRTDSNSSAFSDAHSAFHKPQKNEENRSNARRDFESRFSKGVPEKSLIKMADLIFYNPTTNPMEQNVPIANLDTNKPSDVENVENSVKNEELSKNSIAPVPQLKLNAQGELVLDDKSLEIETTAEQEARKILANSSLIYVDENTGTNGFYKKHKRTKDWTPEETIKFYKCLQTIGTDFSLISQMFTNRSRRDLKLKFKKEEKCNLNLINKAILRPKMFNIEELKKQFEDEESKEAENEKIIVEKKKTKRKRSNRTRASRVLEMEVDIYEDEHEFALLKLAERDKLNANKLSKIRQKQSKENEIKKCNDAQQVNGNIGSSKTYERKKEKGKNKHQNDIKKSTIEINKILQENEIKKMYAQKIKKTFIPKLRKNEDNYLKEHENSAETEQISKMNSALTNNLLHNRETNATSAIKVKSEICDINSFTSDMSDSDDNSDCEPFYELLLESLLEDNDHITILKDILKDPFKATSEQKVNERKILGNTNKLSAELQTNTSIFFCNDNNYMKQEPELVTFSSLVDNLMTEDQLDQQINETQILKNELSSELQTNTSKFSYNDNNYMKDKTVINDIKTIQEQPDCDYQIASTILYTIDNMDGNINCNLTKTLNLSQSEEEEDLQKIIEKNYHKGLVLETTTYIEDNKTELALYLYDKASGVLNGKLDLPESVLQDISNAMA